MYNWDFTISLQDSTPEFAVTHLWSIAELARRGNTKLSDNALCATLSAGLMGFDSAEENSSQHLANFKAYLLKFPEMGHVQADQGLADEMRKSSQGGDWAKFMWDTFNACHRRRFFVTQKGYFGLGPEAMKEGDLCCILFGAMVPFILRRVDHQYVIIGESYIYGVMRGEIVDMWLNGDLEAENFEIR